MQIGGVAIMSQQRQPHIENESSKGFLGLNTSMMGASGRSNNLNSGTFDANSPILKNINIENSKAIAPERMSGSYVFAQNQN